jgi:RNA polymerase sigma-70 factor (ECF subfamily)
MADLQGQSYEAIGEILGVPIGTVRSRLARGRSLLQKRLWDHAVDAGLVAPNDKREEPQ